VSVATIDVPPAIRSGDLRCVVSMSGGKDSTAAALALREADVAFRMVFADTGWEAPETYAHLDHLREKLGPIDVVAAPGGMLAKIQHRAGFPARMQRWCTRELKIEPLRAYHDRIEADERVETVCVMGIRAQESEARAKMAAFADEPAGDRSWGGWLWRPILAWSAEDSYAIHHRHGVDVHPLYKRGHNRVGCYPCIFAQKEEVRLIAEHAPWRIDEIRALEQAATEGRARRNAEHKAAAIADGTYVEPYEEMVLDEETGVVEPVMRGYRPRYGHIIGTYFQGRGEDGAKGMMAIDNVVAWARTTRGGRQLPLLPPAPEGGCVQYGLCEPPTEAT
jgi:3'-phosphoadenosine 5'-phosphosulfate sulfotransferase (PAPS reductase)/FAD synthetase